MLTQAQNNHIAQECNICEPRISRKGEHVFREGEEADAFYVVRSGSIKSYLVTEDGEEQVLGFYLPGDVFGLDTSEDQFRMSSATTLETTSLCRFPHAYLSDKWSYRQLPG
jgi:CRP/FNR family transcriptional regulator